VTGKLPIIIELGGFPTAMSVILRTQGRDITLTDKEQLVFDAILRERLVSGGCVRLVSGEPPVKSAEKEE
jgi:hypothetical protein